MALAMSLSNIHLWYKQISYICMIFKAYHSLHYQPVALFQDIADNIVFMMTLLAISQGSDLSIVT